MAEVQFIYNGVNTTIQCQLNEKMKDICRKFKDKENLNNLNLHYSYSGNLGINGELNFEEIANREDKLRKKMSIIVFDNLIDIKEQETDIIKSKYIICPECKEHIRIDIKDYKINLHNCKKGHKIENILLDEFEESQNINRKDIICNICKKNDKSISYNNIFHKCLTCYNNICPLCKANHDARHIIINYDDNYYICEKHNEKYMLYCEDCNKNLCTLCDGHNNHKRILFTDILPKKDDLLKTKNELKSTIYKFNSEIKILTSILNDVMNKINIYSKIIEDMINNYDNKKTNYEIIFNLNQIQKNNVINELNEIIESNNIIEKFSNIFNIYKKMNHDEINIVYNLKKEKVKLFGEIFIERNKSNLKLFIDGKEHDVIYEYINKSFDKKKDILNIKLKGITNVTNMSGMFYYCESLLSLPDIDKWNTSIIKDMNFIFRNCISLSSLPDISKWNTINVHNMSGIFSNCNSLLSLPDISKWNTSNANNMSSMFSGCGTLTTLPDISKWNTTNVKDMSGMFIYCYSLKSLPDISKWNTSNVNEMSYMFRNCKSLLSLPDLSKWNIKNVNNMDDIFSGCKDSLNIPEKFR